MRQLIDKICQGASGSKPYIVGINGIDASGKSQFAQTLATEFTRVGKQVQLVHVDDFHLPRNVRTQCQLTPPECYYRHTFDWERLEKDVLSPIVSQGTLDRELTLLSLVTDYYDTVKHFLVTPATIVIIEGVFLYTPRLAHYFDFKVFLSITEDECLRRVTERDGYLFGDAANIANRYHQKYLPGQRLYMEECKPPENADLVIVNNDYTRPLYYWR